MSKYSYHPFYFTIFKSLKEQTENNGRKVVQGCFIACSIIYISVAVFGFCIWGDSLKGDILRNICKSNFDLKYVCSVLYLMIAALHTPIVFFVGKEQALTLYCELRYESVSKHPHKNSMLSSTLDAAEYYPITVGLFLLVVLCAVVVKDLGSVFTLLGCTSVCIVFYNTVIFLHVN